MQDPQTDYRLDKRLVRSSFERVAARYDQHAVLQQEVAGRMLERLDFMRMQPRCVADVGAGTGETTLALARRYKHSQVIAMDLARSMLLRARSKRAWWMRWSRRFHYVCCDAEHLPLADDCVDMTFSNLTLQWCNDLDQTLREFQRITRPGGLLMFTTFGPDTLKELRDSWQQVDGHTHVNLFPDMHDVGDALVRARFSDPVMDMEYITLTYRDILQLMHDLKNIGAHNVTAGRARNLTGKARLSALAQAYQHYQRDDRLPATYEVVYGHAWIPEQQQQYTRDDGVTTVPIDQLQRPAGVTQR